MTSTMRARLILMLVAAAAWVPARAAYATETYQYDAVGRLADVAYDKGSSLHYTYDANGNVLSEVWSLTTSVESPGAPLKFALGPMTPNPGGSARELVFTIPSRAKVALRIFDVTGREVATLIDRELPAGHHDVRFLTDRWAAGVYYYRLTAGADSRTGRLVVLR